MRPLTVGIACRAIRFVRSACAVLAYACAGFFVRHARRIGIFVAHHGVMFAVFFKAISFEVCACFGFFARNIAIFGVAIIAIIARRVFDFAADAFLVSGFVADAPFLKVARFFGFARDAFAVGANRIAFARRFCHNAGVAIDPRLRIETRFGIVGRTCDIAAFPVLALADALFDFVFQSGRFVARHDVFSVAAAAFPVVVAFLARAVGACACPNICNLAVGARDERRAVCVAL